MISQKWFILGGKQESGPFTENEILKAMICGEIELSDFVKGTIDVEPIMARKVVSFPRWYFLKVDGAEGPFDVDELKEQIQNGSIGEDDLLRRSDKSEWGIGSSISGLTELFSPLLEGCVTHSEPNQLVPGTTWYWLKDSDKNGPDTTALVKEMIESEDLTGEDLVFHPEQNFWMSVETVPFFDKDRLLSTFPKVMRQRTPS